MVTILTVASQKHHKYLPLPRKHAGSFSFFKLNYLVFLLSLKLQGITLKLSPGSKVALVGPSGGGKVTSISFLNFLKFLFPLFSFMAGI